MAETDVERSEIAAARSRMTDIAVELAHRAEPEHLKEIAREKAEELKAFAKDKADEQVTEMKDRAKETAMRKTYEFKDQISGRPYIGALIGAGLGWLAFQKWLGRRSLTAKSSVSVEPYVDLSYAGPVQDDGLSGGYTEDFYGVDQPPPVIIAAEGHDESFVSGNANVGASSGIKDKASDVAHSAKEKVGDVASRAKEGAAHMADSVRHKAAQVKERMPPPAQIRRSSSAWLHRGISEQPLLFALGAVAVGMIAAALLPVSERERRVLGPAKKKVMEPAMAKAQAALESFEQTIEERMAPPPQSNFTPEPAKAASSSFGGGSESISSGFDETSGTANPSGQVEVAAVVAVAEVPPEEPTLASGEPASHVSPPRH